MVMRIGGIRRKSRYKLTKEIRQRGKISLTRYFQELKDGDKVSLSYEPAVHSGQYHPRFMGKAGIIAGKRGICYQVQIDDMGKQKTLLVHPVHLKRRLR